MKNLMDFPAVKQALEQVVINSDVDNGTKGFEFEAFSSRTETAFDKERAILKKKMAEAIFSGRLEDIKSLEKEIGNSPAPKIFMVFELVKPIPLLKGTKIVESEGKKHGLSINGVNEIWIPEDFIKSGAISYSETGKFKETLTGKTPILKLKLVKGIIDVFPAILDRNDKELYPKRAQCTLLSLRAMQIAGTMSARDRLEKKRIHGYDVIE